MEDVNVKYWGNCTEHVKNNLLSTLFFRDIYKTINEISTFPIKNKYNQLACAVFNDY